MNQPIQSPTAVTDERGREHPARAGSSADVETLRLGWLGPAAELILIGGLLPTTCLMATMTATALRLVPAGLAAGTPTWFSSGHGGDDPLELLALDDDGARSPQDLS